MNRHRKAIYSLRQDILKSESVKEHIQTLLDEEAMTFAPIEGQKKADVLGEIQAIFALEDKDIKALKKVKDENFVSKLKEQVNKAYTDRERAFTKEIMRYVEKEIYLQVLDNLWMAHLESMDHLREGINWRSVGQKDPLVEYRREGQNMFEMMQANMRTDVVRALFHVEPQQQTQEPVETELTKAAEQSTESNSKQAKTSTKTTRKAKPVDTAEDNRKRRQAKKKKKQRRKKGRK